MLPLPSQTAQISTHVSAPETFPPWARTCRSGRWRVALLFPDGEGEQQDRVVPRSILVRLKSGEQVGVLAQLHLEEPRRSTEVLGPRVLLGRQEGVAEVGHDSALAG